MGIKICPDCGGKVSESRSECPHCGYIFGNKITCPDCGKELDSTCLECPDCGYVFEKQEVYQQSPKATTIQVVVERERAFVCSAIAAVVSVDGQQVGSVNNGQQCSFVVTPGLHNFTIGKGLNGPITTNLTDGSRQIDVKPNGILRIKCVMKTKMLLGCYVEIISVSQ